jgi:putative DNA primase/helicase
MTDLQIEPVAHALLGTPNGRLSKETELRYGAHGSLSINITDNVWFDHEANEGGGVLALIKRETGVHTDREALQWLDQRGLNSGAKHNGNGANKSNNGGRPNAKPITVESYEYHTATGDLALVVDRRQFRLPEGSFEMKDGKPDKTFQQRRPDRQNPGQWHYNANGVSPLIYRLSEIVEAAANGHTIHIVEGERKANALWAWNIPATCNPGGACKWRPEHSEFVRGAHVVVLPDNDPAGCAHLEKLIESLTGVANKVQVVELPGLPSKGDIIDWIEAGGTREQFDALAKRDAAEWIAARNASSPGAPGLEIKCLAEVQPKPIEWLWSNWIAIGKVAILAGEGGKGKSTILCDLAARTTHGYRWPDGAEASAPGDVIILTAEDDLEDTLAPRLIAAGADLKRVFNIRSVRNDDLSRRTFNLQTDLARLEAEINARKNVRLVIIDPVSSYLGKADSHKNAEVRSVLEPLGDLAARTRTAILANNHFSKGGGSANNRMIGSVAFVNYARAGFIVTPDAENEGRMLLMPSKMNIAPIKYGMAYRIESAVIESAGVEILTSRIAWESQPVKITADEALAANDTAAENRTGKAEAIEFLRDALSGGPRPANEVKQEATSAGITPKCLRTARKSLGVRLTKQGMSGGWVWALPKVPSPPEDAHFREWAPSDPEGTFGRENSDVS